MHIIVSSDLNEDVNRICFVLKQGIRSKTRQYSRRNMLCGPIESYCGYINIKTVLSKANIGKIIVFPGNMFVKVVPNL